MIPARRAFALGLTLGLALLWSSDAAAHPMRFGLLELSETAPGRFAIEFHFSGREGATLRGEPILPEHCALRGEPRVTPISDGFVSRFEVDCGERGLAGPVGVRGLGESSSQALLTLRRLDGSEERRMLDALRPTLHVGEGQRAYDAEGAQTFRTYAALGFEHILFGFDHLLFVLGLLLLVSGWRRLIGTITAFTLGHSLTLALATLGLVRVPSSAVEACIALSILMLAVELTRLEAGPASLTREHPWLVATAFGLLHGLGFASALTEIGLPSEEIPMALFSFNVGVEGGQLLFVILALGVVHLRRTLAPPSLSRRVLPYLIGSLSAYWCIERVSAFWS